MTETLKSQFLVQQPAAPMAPTLDLLSASIKFMLEPNVSNAQVLGGVYANEGRDTTDLGNYFTKNRITSGGPAASVGMAKR